MVGWIIINKSTSNTPEIDMPTNNIFILFSGAILINGYLSDNSIIFGCGNGLNGGPLHD